MQVVLGARQLGQTSYIIFAQEGMATKSPLGPLMILDVLHDEAAVERDAAEAAKTVPAPSGGKLDGRHR